MDKSIGQAQRLDTRHPSQEDGMKGKSDPTRNCGKDTLLTLSPAPTPAALTQWRCENLPKRGTLNSIEAAGTSKKGKEIKLLKWRIGELEQGNPVPSRSNETSGVRRDDTGGTLNG